jgi:hypothetical protein
MNTREIYSIINDTFSYHRAFFGNQSMLSCGIARQLLISGYLENTYIDFMYYRAYPGYGMEIRKIVNGGKMVVCITSPKKYKYFPLSILMSEII